MGGANDRKHRATGKPRGGTRDRAGRPTGSTNALELGEVRGVKALGLRVPEGAAPDVRALADRAQQRIIDVMEGDVEPFAASTILKAATHLREETCGPIAKQVNLAGANGEQLTINVVSLDTDDEPEPEPVPDTLPTDRLSVEVEG